MIDAVLVSLICGAAYLGYRRGFLVSATALGAFAMAGLIAGAIAVAIGSPPPALAFMLGGALGLVPVALRLDHVTASVDALVGDGRARTGDRAAGALLNVALGLVLAWFVGAVASIVPATSPGLTAVRTSSTMGVLVESVPPTGTLGAIVLRSGLIPSLNGPLVLADPPDPSITGLTAVAVARGSVVQVRGRACARMVTGTAWVAAPGLLLTNAHVVAGMRQVFLASGPTYTGRAATVTWFDAHNDVAVLALDGAQLPPAIPISTRVLHGEPAAAIGFPRGGEQQTTPARIDRAASWETVPVGGGPERMTRVLAFRADLQSGNSGGPVVAADGTALGMVVAKGLNQRIAAAYGVPGAELLAAIAEGARRVPVSTGPCDED
ncbi:MAG: Colicin production protein [Thermoleophilia bacterium]|nr:Colicin production protein [Thermoleophilia bacterium]MCZ4497148.1 Colicin production protein [Thermoleophilia bacterium]